MEHQPLVHPHVQGDLQRLDRVVAAVRIAGIIRLAHAADEMPELAPDGQGRRQGEEEEVAARDERVGQAVLAEGDLGLSGEGRVADLPQDGEVQQVIVPEPLAPSRRKPGEPSAKVRPAVQLDPVALAVVEADGLDPLEPLQRPGEAGG
jgi:hypothetical protein